jgi:hypothetical protein
MNEAGPLEGQSPDEDARQSWANAGIVYDFYKNTFGRDSFDLHGTRIKLVVNVPDSSWCPNAGWANSIHTMFYCDGRGGSLDVLTHEFTHGVVETSAQLIGIGETAALNESYADVFAAFLEGARHDAQGQKSVLTWQISWDAEGLELIRDLAHPAEGYPSHYEDLVQPGEGLCTKEGEKKAGCPHINSSIPSLAAFLAAEGGTHHDITVRGIGRTKLQYIYYEAVTYRLTKNANFAQARAATLRACWYLTGRHGITTDDCDPIRDAFTAVGVGEPSAPAQPNDFAGWLNWLLNTDWLKWFQNSVRDAGRSLQEWARQQFDALAGDIRQRIAALLRDLERQIQEAIRRGIQSLIQLIVQLILDALRQLFQQVCGAPLVSLGAPILAVVWWWRRQRR